MPKLKNPLTVVKNMTDEQKVVAKYVAVFTITAAAAVTANYLIDKKLDAENVLETAAE